MTGLTNDETRAHLTAHTELSCEGRGLWFPGPQSAKIKIDLRVNEPHQLIYLARLIAHIGYDEIHFSHACLWLTTWGVWDQQTEAIGFKMFEQIRRSYGENRSIEAAPGTYFRHDEFTVSASCLLQPMLIGWDAYYVPTWVWGTLDYFVFVSHDGFIEVNIRTQEMHQRATEILEGHGWIKPLLK
ncbi:MAG TPA: hypothetical protein VMD99_02880 [Terriglobales bacterium]|nr:hypothetical protein [Terriglobales bacterium]